MMIEKKLYTEEDVERFMREALEAAAKRCELMSEICARKAGEATGENRDWLLSRSYAAEDCAHKIRALDVTRRL